jgi:hypothetical protein
MAESSITVEVIFPNDPTPQKLKITPSKASTYFKSFGHPHLALFNNLQASGVYFSGDVVPCDLYRTHRIVVSKLQGGGADPY